MRDWLYYTIIAGAIVGSAALINWRLANIETRLDGFDKKFVSKETFDQSIKTAEARVSDIQHQLDLVSRLYEPIRSQKGHQ